VCIHTSTNATSYEKRVVASAPICISTYKRTCCSAEGTWAQKVLGGAGGAGGAGAEAHEIVKTHGCNVAHQQEFPTPTQHTHKPALSHAHTQAHAQTIARLLTHEPGLLYSFRDVRMPSIAQQRLCLACLCVHSPDLGSLVRFMKHHKDSVCVCV